MHSFLVNYSNVNTIKMYLNTNVSFRLDCNLFKTPLLRNKISLPCLNLYYSVLPIVKRLYGSQSSNNTWLNLVQMAYPPVSSQTDVVCYI